MKDDDSLPVSTPTSMSSLTSKKEIASSSTADHSSSPLLGRGRYKVWAFAAILLLAVWSIVTGTVTLRWSASHLEDLSDRDSIDFPLPDDLDVLEMEEREKLVRHMWDVYTSNGRRIGLVKFWEDAFKSAYEEMTSDVPRVRDGAVSEIAKMSLHSVHLESPSFNSRISRVVRLFYEPLNIEDAENYFQSSIPRRKGDDSNHADLNIQG